MLHTLHVLAPRTAAGVCVKPRAVPQSNPRTTFAKLTNRGRARSTVVAYRNDDRLIQTKRSAEWFPTALNTTDLRALPNACSTDHKHHTSVWHRELVENHGRAVLGPGSDEYEKALEEWRSAYPIAEEHLHLVVAQENDAFLMSIMTVENTGQYLGQEPSGGRSSMAAAYRLNLNEHGRVAASWVYRSGTKEEHKALLRHPEAVDDLHWIRGLTIYPCTWEPTKQLRGAMIASVNSWVHDVWAKHDLKKITQLMAPDVVMYDCTAIGVPHKGPVVGERGIRQLLSDVLEGHDYEVGMVPLAIAADGAGNQVFLHWTQCLVDKATGAPSRQSGISLFVFDHQCRVVQILQFGEPLESARQQLYQERHLMRVHE